MRTSFVCLGVILAAGPLAAQQAVQHAAQSDWSGGEGVAGPVTAWGDQFDAATNLSTEAVPGRVLLSGVAEAVPPAQRISVGDRMFGVEIADVDGDGDLDVLTAADGDQEVAWWENDGGNPIVWTKHLIAPALPGANGIAVGDFDLDGRIDVVASAAMGQSELSWWRNGGGDPIVWTKEVLDPTWQTCFEVNVADVNSDGRPDLIATSWDGMSVAWWENAPGAPITWTKQVVDSNFNGAHSANAADLDGDGDADIIATGGFVDEVAYWRNDGGSPITWTKFVIRTGFTGGRSVTFGDYDQDGDLDVAGTCWTKEVTWWRNDGGDPIVWTETILAPGFTGGHHIQSADVNGDGRLDLVAAGYMVHDVAWWENHGGSPVTWTKQLVRGNFLLVTEIATGDIDGNGACDIAAVSYRTGGNVTWWDVTNFAATGELESSVLDTTLDFPNAKLAWEATVPAGSELRFQVRSSNDAANLGAWSAEYSDPGVVGDLERFVQYRALFSTSDPTVSPTLDEVSVAVPSVTVRTGSGVNAEVFRGTNLPLLGGSWNAEIDTGAAGVASGLSIIVAHNAPLNPGLPLLVGEVLIDPTSAWLATDVETVAGALCLHSIPIPSDLAFVGARAFTQAYLDDGGGTGRLTNAVDLVMGY